MSDADCLSRNNRGRAKSFYRRIRDD